MKPVTANLRKTVHSCFFMAACVALMSCNGQSSQNETQSSVPQKSQPAPETFMEIPGPPTPFDSGSSADSRELQSDWNLVSFPIVERVSVESYLASSSISSQLQSIWQWDQNLDDGAWRVFPPTASYATLSHLTPDDGYWVRARGTVTLTGDGTTNLYNIVKGWNLVGVSHTATEVPTADFFSTGDFWKDSCGDGKTLNNAWTWKDSTWQLYFPDDADRVTFNLSYGTSYETISAIEPGMGLWVNANRNNAPQPAGGCPGDHIETETHVRYNHIGYSPSRDKKFIVMANREIQGIQYRVSKSQEVVMSGTVGESLAAEGDYTPFGFNYEIDLSTLQEAGDYTLSIGLTANPLSETVFHINAGIYSSISTDLLRHLKQERSGTADTLNHEISHVSDSATSLRRSDKDSSTPDAWTNIDGTTVEMQGGWYDAGDYIKFTLTNALTTYYLLRSYEIAPDLHNTQTLSQTDLVDVLDEAKHGLDYLMKLMPSNDDFILQVGSDADHSEDDRLPENDALTGYDRPAFSAMVPQYMALTSAALAHGARTFKDIGQTEQAALYLAQAEAIWARAQQSDVLGFVAYEKSWFYPDNSINDNMALGAIELYNATENTDYLDLAKQYSVAAGQGEYTSWETLNLAANMRVREHDTAAADLVTGDLAHFMTFADTNIWGKPLAPVWAGMYNYFQVSGAAALRAADGDATQVPLIYDSLDYMLGRNNWGVSFFASTSSAPSVENIYNQIYRLTEVFPTGAVAEGPLDAAGHADNVQWMIDGTTIQSMLEASPFNTSAEVFVDHDRDYATMETTIFGQAATLYMMSAIYKYENN